MAIDKIAGRMSKRKQTIKGNKEIELFVEVVHCKDCRWGDTENENYDGTVNVRCAMHGGIWFGDDFCNTGYIKVERR